MMKNNSSVDTGTTVGVAASRVLPLRVLASVLGAIALVLIVDGIWLLALGGSGYYVLAGIAMGASAALLWQGRREGGEIYAILLALTVAWAVWESGFDGWALAPRLITLFVLGGWLLLPWLQRALKISPASRIHLLSTLSRPAAFFALLIGAVVLGALLHLLQPTRLDPAFAPIPAGAALQADATEASHYAPAAADWTSFGGDPGGRRYSSLDQITPANVNRLKVAWTAHVGMNPPHAKGSLEVTPLKVGDSVYVCTAYNDLLAFDAETGVERWRYNANIPKEGYGRCRGIVYFASPVPTTECAARIITNTMNARLIAVDARTGALCKQFGENGQTSLREGMGDVPSGYYYVTSAPTLVNGKIVLGGWVSDGQFWGEPSGVIRAFDAVTGKFAWAFDVGRPHDHGEPPAGQTYTRATPNSWAPMSADETLGLVYVPTGIATPDYYGVQRRPFDDQYSSSVIALDASTGEVRWSFQTTHHDLWDYDVASQPLLIDVTADGGTRHALLQATKRGEIFMLDRVTGQPIAAVEERVVSTDGVPGEKVSPTQPFSVGLPSFRGPDLAESMMWGLTPIDQMICRIQFKKARYHGPLTPPNLTPMIKYPGTLGGIDWGGIASDPERQIMIVPSDRVANYDTLITRDDAEKKGFKPNSQLTDSVGPHYAQGGTPYGAIIKPFLSALDAPCQQPPYGMLSAVDLKTHRTLWSRPLGTARDSGPFGVPSLLPILMGTPMAGSALITKSGLVFIGATQEKTFHALDLGTGQSLWEARLPAGGQAGPITYLSSASGRQFVLLPAGGNTAIESGTSDDIVAYALPADEH